MNWTTWWPALLFAAEASLRLAVVIRIIMRGPRSSANALAWILVLLFLPVLGLTLWVFIGEARLGERRRRAHAEISERLGLRSVQPTALHRDHWENSDYATTISLAKAVGGTPPRAGNELQLMGNSSRFIELLAQDIDQAQSTCHLLFYIFLDDGSGRRVASALGRAAARGVACRLLVDGVGSRTFLNSELCKGLQRDGVSVVEALPAHLLRVVFARVDLRNHRKIAVIDGSIGYTGSQNIADASFAPKPRYAPWVDCMLRIRGPVVHDLQSIFITDWYLDTEEVPDDLLEQSQEPIAGGVPIQILPTGPNNDNEALTQLALAAFHGANEELILTTPYFVPGESEVASLCTAAKRGVEVSLVVPARNDSKLVGAVIRSHFQRLTEDGVKVYEYQKGLLHAKTLTVDRDLALVTTANFDQRSFDLNFEVSALVYDSDFASQLRFLQREYIESSELVGAQRIRGRSWAGRLFDNAAGVFSPLL